MKKRMDPAPARRSGWRRARGGCLVALVFCTVAARGQDTTSNGILPWRSGVVLTGQQDAVLMNDTLGSAARSEARHVVVQFNRPLALGERAELSAAGVDLLNYIGDNAFFAAVGPQGADDSVVARVGNWRCVLPIEPHWKVHPDFLTGPVPAFAVVSAPTAAAPQAIVGAYVVFHPDVPLEPDGVKLCQQFGTVVRATLTSINAAVIELPLENIPYLAEQDAVQWIEPPLPPLDVNNNSNRARVGADVVSAPPYGLTGAGVTVLVYDSGTGQASHLDFGGRLHVRDNSGTVVHSSHVAGTIGGSGAASNGLYRGMAPAVTIEAYGFQTSGPLDPNFLYANPGDIEHDYHEAIATYGANLASNSIGTNTALNGFPCEREGNYGVTDMLIDTIVRGDGSNPLFTTPFRVVWSNGDERKAPARCGAAYHTTAPPACAKNHIAVGAVNSNDDSMTSFSSWGPADDGRLKPDVCGPGCQSDDDFGVTSCNSNGGYATLCGASMACPTVAGIGALLLEDFRAHYPAQPDFRNSTLKALLAHTAADLGNLGPDYQYGYGSVRALPAVDLLRRGDFLEDALGQGDLFEVTVLVSPGDAQLKVTLAWDDVPGTPNVNPALVNDLDLRVFDATGNPFFPWTLDPNNPAMPAVRARPDHVNNIEQVQIDDPTPGVYRVEVHGYNVPSGPQPFSLVATPGPERCSAKGTLTLDRPKYTCQTQVSVCVMDCDLNADPNAADLATVTLVSTSDPIGRTATLVETTPASAVFVGTVAVSTSGGTGFLLIAPGDVLTATYIDADNGLGGTNVPVSATAVVDCVAPVISDVQATPSHAYAATVTCATDEPAQVTVYYGTSCAALTASQTGAAFQTAHRLDLTGLSPTTPYFFAVDGVDEAGNPATDDNGGACYTFTTPAISKCFTELFVANNDLDNTSLTFTPDGSSDFYTGCATAITALPTDPNAGVSLTLLDDDFVALSPSAPVSFYGITYSTFYVGSNGYITFDSGDRLALESLASHFDQPRISALFDDLSPPAGGYVRWRQLDDRVAVTWWHVPEFDTSNANTFQIELFLDGKIRISYLALAALDGLTGLSRGGGVPPDFATTDMSNLICGPRRPRAMPAGLQIDFNESGAVALEALDDGLPNPPGLLSYVITALPTHGHLYDPGADAIASVPYTLVDHGHIVEYDPKPYYGGPDSFTFLADDGGSPPDGGPSDPATVAVSVGGKQLVYSFPLDTDPGWSTQGQWAFGQPTGAGSHNLDPLSGHTGPNVYGYNLDGDYPINMPVYYLTTPALDCRTFSETELRFWRWLGIESSSYDHASIQASNDGTNWTTIWEHTSSAIADTAWTQQVFNIAAVADDKPTVYIRWGLGPTDDDVTYPGWNIDDIEIWGACPPDPLGDVNCDGVVNFDDINPFIFTLTDPDGYAEMYPDCNILYADINGDDVVNFADINPFVMLLTQGRQR